MTLPTDTTRLTAPTPPRSLCRTADPRTALSWIAPSLSYPGLGDPACHCKLDCVFSLLRCTGQVKVLARVILCRRSINRAMWRIILILLVIFLAAHVDQNMVVPGARELGVHSPLERLFPFRLAPPRMIRRLDLGTCSLGSRAHLVRPGRRHKMPS